MTLAPIKPRSPLCESPAEELASAITHGIGTALSIAALVIMIILAKGPLEVVSAALFGSSLTLLYLASTLYHSFSGERTKDILQIFDHSCIYLLIAGSYTPVALVVLPPAWGWSIFGTVWGLAALGLVYKFAGRGRRDSKLSTAIYLAMGWLIVVAFVPLVRSIGTGGLVLLICGGVCYSVGVIFFVWEKLRFNHAIWHLFVLGGSACHVLSAMLYMYR